MLECHSIENIGIADAVVVAIAFLGGEAVENTG